MCALCGDIQRGQKRDSDFPELELHVVVSLLMSVLEMNSGPLKEASALNHRAISPAPLNKNLKNPLKIKKKMYFMCLIVCACHVQAWFCSGQKTASASDPWNWHFRWFWITMLCWELGPVYCKNNMLLWAISSAPKYKFLSCLFFTLLYSSSPQEEMLVSLVTPPPPSVA